MGMDANLTGWGYVMKWMILSALLCFYSISAHAQIYKWVDEQGNTQYSSQPPAATAARSERKLNIKVRPTPKSEQPVSATKSIADERAEFDKRRKKKMEDKEKRQVEARAKSTKCFHAQGRLKTYRDTARLTVPDGKGGIQYVDDQLRQKKIAAANKDIETYCS